MSFVVLHSGISSRIVDEGRPKSRSLGVPVGGAADRRSLAIGNALLGNPAGTAALEVCAQGPRLRAAADVGCVVFGAPFAIHVDGRPIEAGHTFTIHADEELRIGGARAGLRAYLCVRGGLESPVVLASRDSLQPVSQGEILTCAESRILVRFCPELQPGFPGEWTVRVLPGLQAHLFDEAEWQQTYTVAAASDRMGLRLEGKPLRVPAGELLSEPVCPGAIQVMNNGQCIVLGVDAQTIGGYPKIAQVIQADLDALGQIGPGQRVRFVKVNMDEAIRAGRDAQQDLRWWTMRLRLSLVAFDRAINP